MNKFLILLAFIFMSLISRGQSFSMVNTKEFDVVQMYPFIDNNNFDCFFSRVYQKEQEGWIISDDSTNIDLFVDAYVAYRLIKEGMSVQQAIEINEVNELFWDTLFYDKLNNFLTYGQ